MRRTPTLTRRAAIRRAARDGTVPAYQTDYLTRRGHCRKCGNRWALIRVIITLTSAAAIERYATTECSRCSHTWRRIPASMTIQSNGVQRVRLNLLLPRSDLKRWHSHGAWHREGDDTATLRDANLTDLDEAVTAWKTRNAAYYAARDRAKAKREAARLADHEATVILLDRLAEKDRLRATEEAAATQREGERDASHT